MSCPRKTLNNFRCLPTPPTLGTDGQLLVSDGNEGTRWSTSLLRDQSAVLSAYAATNFNIPANSGPYVLAPDGPDGGTLGIDFSATTARGFEVFALPSGANNTDQQVMVQVSYSVSWAANNTGDRSIWLQVSDGLVLKPARYGLSTTPGDLAGNAQAASTIIGLLPGEFGIFLVENTSNSIVAMLGGDIAVDPLVTKFQSALIN